MTISRYAITNKGRYPYFGPSWDLLGIKPTLFTEFRDAAEAVRKLNTCATLKFYVIKVEYDLTQDEIDQITSTPTLASWEKLIDSQVSHIPITNVGDRHAF